MARFIIVLALPRILALESSKLACPASWQSNLLVLPASWQVITRQRVAVSAECDQVIKKTLPKPGHRKIAGCSCLFVGRTNRTILIISLSSINLG